MIYLKKSTMFFLILIFCNPTIHGMETPPMVVHFPGIKCPAPQIHLPPALFTKSLGAVAFGIAAANTILLLAKLHAESGQKKQCDHNNNSSYMGAYGLSAATAGTGIGLSLAYDNSALTFNIGAFVFSAAGAFALSHYSKKS
jgi:hypothetical protein